MQQQILRQESGLKNNPSLVHGQHFLLIESCQACHQHRADDPHDESVFYLLLQGIHKELNRRQLKQVQLVKNRPFKYMALMEGKDLVYKPSSVKDKYEYVNLQTKRVERFPRIGSFEVYYDNFVVFSLLKSSFKVKAETEPIVQCSDSSPNMQSTGESEVADKEVASSTNQMQAKVLCELIVRVIEVLDLNNVNVQFLQKVDNVFRFLQLQWKKITFEQSLIEYMFKKTPKEQISSIDVLLKPLLELTQSKLVQINPILNHNKNQKNVLPYTYYKSGQKTSRIRSIYQDKSIKGSFVSTTSLMSKTKQPQPIIPVKLQTNLHKRNTTSQVVPKPVRFKKDPTNKPSFMSHSPSSVSIKRVSKETHKSILAPKLFPSAVQKKKIQIEALQQPQLQKSVQKKKESVTEYKRESKCLSKKDDKRESKRQSKRESKLSNRYFNKFEHFIQPEENQPKNFNQHNQPQISLQQEQENQQKIETVPEPQHEQHSIFEHEPIQIEETPSFQSPQTQSSQFRMIFQPQQEQIEQIAQMIVHEASPVKVNQFLKESLQNQPKSSKPEGFIIKRHFKKTSVPKFQFSDEIEPIQATEPQRKPYGFIYKNDILKEKLISNQINFESTRNSESNNTNNFPKKIDKNIGKIFKSTKKTQREGIQGKNSHQTESKQLFSQKIFKRTKQVKSVNNRISEKKNPKNLVRNCFSQRRPLSSNIKSKIFTMRNANQNDLITVSQKNIEGKKNRGSSVPKTEVQWRETKANLVQSIQNLRLSDQSNKRSQSKREERLSSNKDKDIKPIQAQHKYSKDFVKQNIRKVSVLKKSTTNHGFSASFSQNFGYSKEKEQKKSFSYFKKDTCSSHVRTLSSNDKTKKQGKNGETECDNWDQKISRLVDNNRQSKSNSSISKSLHSFCDKGSKKVLSQKQEELDETGRQKIGESQKMNWIREEGAESGIKKQGECSRVNKIQESASQGFQMIENSPKRDNKDLQVEGRKFEEPTPNQQNEARTEQKAQLEQNSSSFTYVNHLFTPMSLSNPTNLITYTLASQEELEPQNQAQIMSSNHLKTNAYYNHQLYLEVESYIKYEPAYLTNLLGYENALEQSEKFSNFLRSKKFTELDRIAEFSFQGEEIYQQYAVKSLRQLYKLDTLKLFPPQWAKNPSFDTENLVNFTQSQSNSSILYDTLSILIKSSPKMISRLFENVKTVSYIGYYGVWLYNMAQGKFQLVIIDDQFCVLEDLKTNDDQDTEPGFIFGQIFPQKSVWFMVLEKAMAKMLGGYGNLYKSSFAQIFKLLTGCQYVEFKDLSLQKLSKIFSEKVLNNKKALTFATVSQNNCNQSEEFRSHAVEKITGWNFNEKNPFLSLIHFESPNRRIQSVTMMDFSRQYDGITMVFFNPNFVYNYVPLRMQNSIKNSNKKMRVIEITSNTYSKDNLCYISVTHDDKNDQDKSEKRKGFKKSLKTTLKLYKQVFAYETTERQNNLCQPQKQQQDYETETQGHNFRYNGEITKNGEFFFEVGLKGGKNLCFVETEVENLNIGFYSEDKVEIKTLIENDASMLKLINGEAYGNQMENVKKFSKDKIKQIQKTKQERSDIFREKKVNNDMSKKKDDKILTRSEVEKKKNELKKSNLIIQSKSSNKCFLEDEVLQNRDSNEEEEFKKKNKFSRSKKSVR